MIHGIGIDTESVGRVERLLAENAEIIGRIFTDGERAAAKNLPLERRVEIFAAAFAGKEAVMKALGTGWNGNVDWAEIEIPLADSEMTARLYGASARFAEKAGVSRIVVGFSATRRFVVATAIAEKEY